MTAARPSPALQVAEVQQVKLPAVLGVIDGVHILGATLPMSLSAAEYEPLILYTELEVTLTLRDTHALSSYPLHLLFAADAIIVAQSRVRLRESS